VRSALYLGSVRHRRFGTPANEFRHRLFMVYLDLGELPGSLEQSRLWSARRPALAWFRRSDHLGDPTIGLEESVRRLLAERTGRCPEGPIGLLTHLRYFGHCFNPVSFYYCWGPGGEELEAVIAHVTNTPWGESHAYVMPVAAAANHGTATVSSGSFEKVLHVSPLMGMEHVYELRVTDPAERLSVHISSADRTGRAVFDATLALSRQELTARNMAMALARYPFLTIRIMARIYSHALRLRLRGARYFPHPAGKALPAYPRAGRPPVRGAGK
jgi:hypothetical protein